MKASPTLCCLLYLFDFFRIINGECYYSSKTSDHPWKHIIGIELICNGTSTEHYIDDIFKLELSQSNFINTVQLIINKSDFPVLRNLKNPLKLYVKYKNLDNESPLGKVTELALNSCGIKWVAKKAFDDFQELKQLDLGYNEIDDLGFVESLSQNIIQVNLTHNDIKYLDFKHFNAAELISIDFSFNKIHSVILDQKVMRAIIIHLNLSHNNIKVFQRNNDYTQLQIKVSDQLDLSNSIRDITLLSPSAFISKNLLLSNNRILSLDNTWDFKQTQSLDLSNCSLSSVHSQLFQNLPNLKYLNLSRNNLKFLSRSSFTTSSFEELNLSHNRLEDVSEVFVGSKIVELILTHNRIKQLTENFFSSLRVLKLDLSFNTNLVLKEGCFNSGTYLVSLNLAGCNISQLPSNAFVALNALTTLNLTHNSLKALEGDIFKPLQAVNTIDISHNKLAIIASQTFTSNSLKIILLSYNEIREIHEQAFHIPHIDSIQINDNKAVLNLSNSSFSNGRVDTISIQNCLFQNSINFTAFSSMYELRSLDLRNISLSHIDFCPNDTSDSNIKELQLSFKGNLKKGQFQNLPFLTSLTFWNFTVIDTIEPEAFHGLYLLQELKFSGCLIENVPSGALDGLFSVLSLDARNLFKNTAVLSKNSFRHLRSLLELNLSSIQLNGLEPLVFQGLKSLTTLDLSRNALTNLQNSVFFGLEQLKNLDLNHNLLTVLHSDIFSGLEGLRILNLKSNNISDIHLGALQAFPSLERLSLANNYLTEFKVGAFSNLLFLESLQLQHNMISSLLFESFLPLKSLVALNLEHNYLKTIQHISLASNLVFLKKIGIANNKWKCEYLADLLVTFRNRPIDYSSRELVFRGDNIDGIGCIDVCKFVLCLKDSHGIN